MKNNRVIFFVGAVVVVMLTLFIYPKISNRTATTYSGSLPCLVDNLPLAMHIHPMMKVVVDGKDETIPGDIGLNGTCELPLHTHDATGMIHAESQTLRDYTLNEFMEVWGKPLQREGYNLAMTVDGKPSVELGNLVLKDKQEITLSYKKLETGN